MKPTFLLFLFFFSVQLTFAQTASSSIIPPRPTTFFVSDFEGIFTTQQRQELEKLVKLHEEKTSNEVVVVTIDSYTPYETLFDYSFALAERWGVGKQKEKNGIAIVFGKEIREIRIQIGYGLEEKLRDEEAKKIIDNIIIPAFKEGDFYGGIKAGLLEIFKEIE